MEKLALFTKDDLKKIHSGTMRILENTGIVVDDKEALNLFAAAGAVVDTTGGIVKIPSHIVEAAINTAPSTIYLAGRGNKGFYLGDGKVRFCSFGEAPQIIDPYTLVVRKATKGDAKNYAKIVDALEHHDMCWDALVPSDVPASVYALHSLDAYFNNTVKPICIATPNGILATAAVQMAAAVAGDNKKLRKSPLIIAGTCPQSPLYLDKGICQSIITLARAGIPNMNMSALTAGGTGPVTLAGTVMVHNAEMLASLVLSQLAYEGAPYIYGSCTSGLDLKKATATYGCPEIALFSAALTQLTQNYGLPQVVAGCWSDSKTADMQCGHEKTLNGLLPALSGADMVFGTGCLAAGMIGSLGQLVADNEVIAMLRRILQGIPVNDTEMALEIIERVGPKGNFLAEEHTMKHMRRSLAQPSLLDRNTYSQWVNDGSEELITRANRKARDILADHTVPALGATINRRFNEIIAEAELKLKKGGY
ncbi:MAG: trimethylamine methyltransferase family protein [Bacillota bacterium]|nr:trimethylamine methyltransferase family protein [Bacillota bacterium]